MPDRKPGLRIQYSEMFREEVDHLYVIDAQGRVASERGKQAFAHIQTIEQEARRLPIGVRVKDFFVE